MATEGKRISDIVTDEISYNISREEVTVAQNENLVIGTIIGKVTKELGSATKTGTGGGTIGTITMGVNAQIGNYTAVCTATATNGGTFTVYAPSGSVIGFATVGSAFTSPHINFTISDGNPDFVLGDTFTIPVNAGSGKVKGASLTAVDGTQDAYGILLADVNATVDTKASALVAMARVKKDNLTYPSGATTAQKNKLLNDLKAKFIVAASEI